MHPTAVTKAPFELAVERYIDAPTATVFKVWTERLAEWWCPQPWTTEVIEQDLRPGGRSALIRRGPAGEKRDMEGVISEVVPNERIVFTDAFTAGWFPQTPFMVGLFEFTRAGKRTTVPALVTGTRRRTDSVNQWASSKGGRKSPSSWRKSPRPNARFRSIVVPAAAGPFKSAITCLRGCAAPLPESQLQPPASTGRKPATRSRCMTCSR